MWNVDRPVFDAEHTYTLCISKVQDDDLKTRLTEITDNVVDASATYAECAESEELHLVPQTHGVGGRVTTEEMVAVYSYRMAGKVGPGRSIYDALKLAPSFGICPFCNHNVVSTLDHILPKTLFPALAVTPDNLVGACKDCNKAKLALAPTCAADAVLHPYFDNISGERWLEADVIESNIAAAIFHVTHIEAWSDELNARVRNQFEILGLGPLYASQAAREISGQRADMVRIFNARGQDGVREELSYKAATWEAHQPNCWQAATFRALSQSDWYCSGGFENQ